MHTRTNALRFEDEIQLLGHFEGDSGLADDGRV
jgi:hypothetical protein